MTKQCNDMDTASLLIALLRVSNIPARYVYGTIEVPIEKVMNWVGGFTDEQAALNFIASGGTPTTGLISGGKIVAARMEHAWVEGYVDMIPSFGAVHKQGDTWIPMDGSFKQYTYANGIDLQAAVPFDAQGFFNQVKSTATINEAEGSVTNVNAAFIQTTMTDFQTRLQDYLNTNLPNATVGAIIGKKEIIAKTLPVLAETLLYKTVVKAKVFPDLPDNLRHKVTFNLLDEFGFDSVITVTKALPEIAGHKLTVSYAPAGSSDESLLLSYVNKGANSLPAYLIRLKPELRINGQVVSLGNSIGMGKSQQLDMTLSAPTISTNIISNNLIAGTYNAVVFDLGITVSKQLDDSAERAKATKAKIESNNLSGITKDDVMGEFLEGMGLGYWGMMDVANRVASRINGVVDARLPSEGIFIYDLKVNFAFGVPFSAIPGGFATDIDHDSHVVFAKNGDKTKPVSFMATTGMLGSKMEASVYDFTFNKRYSGRGISTAHIFEYANQQGMPLYTIDSSNMNTVLPLLQVGTDVKTDIQNAINAGKVVTIPKGNIHKDGWTGSGYLIFDPNTGAGAYMISGGLAGGGYSCNCFGFDTTTEFIMGIILVFSSLFLPIAAAILSLLLITISYLSFVCQINEKENLTPHQKALLMGLAVLTLIGVPFVFAFGSVGLALSLYWLGMSLFISHIFSIIDVFVPEG